MNHKEELKKLIEIVKEAARLSGDRLTIEKIAERLGYERPYLSQLTGAKGVVNETHVLLFKERFKRELESAGIPLPGESANEGLALVLAIFDDYSERMSQLEKVEKEVVEKRVRSKANLILIGLNGKK